jgi:hypothetical protein
VIKLFSTNSLRKTGIFADEAGDFDDFDLKVGEGVIQRRKGMRKSRDFRPILSSLGRPGQAREWVAGDAVLIAPVSRPIPC